MNLFPPSVLYKAGAPKNMRRRICMEDAELVKKMISGDMDAFDRLME